MEPNTSAAAAATREKLLPPSTAVCDSFSWPSYKEYPARRSCRNTLGHHTTQKRPGPFGCPSPSKACPETSCTAILSALKNLQEKIRRLELEKGCGELSPHALRNGASHSQEHGDKKPDATGDVDQRPDCNQVLLTHLAAAENRCVKLERQLEHMRRMLRNAKMEQAGLLKQQVSMETSRPDDAQPDSEGERHQREKLERLEQQYLRLTRTQNQAEIKLHELERKLQAEEQQRKQLQHQANELESGLQANRILLQSVSPCLSTTRFKGKRDSAKKSPPRTLAFTQPRCRLSLGDVPFVAGTSAGCSHSVRANVQSVLSLLKRHQPLLSSSSSTSSSSSSSSSSASGDELSELLQAFQKELRLMTLEQDELVKRLELRGTPQDRRKLQRAQKTLLQRMERKREQIGQLLRHRVQMKKLSQEVSSRPQSRTEAATTRGRSAGAVKLKPGERSRRNLRLLRDIRSLQTSLQT